MTVADACLRRYCAAVRATSEPLLCVLGSRTPPVAAVAATVRTRGSVLRFTPEGLAVGRLTGVAAGPPTGTIKRSPSRTSGLSSLFAASRLVAARWYFFTMDERVSPETTR